MGYHITSDTSRHDTLHSAHFSCVPPHRARMAAAASGTEPDRTSSRRAQHRGRPSRLYSSPRMSPEDLDEARQRLIASRGYKNMVDRVDGNSPFVDLDGSSSRGVTEEEEEPPASSFLRQLARGAVDMGIALVPVVLVVTFAKFPPPVAEALGSAASAIKASPIEPVRARRGGGCAARAYSRAGNILSTTSAKKYSCIPYTHV